MLVTDLFFYCMSIGLQYSSEKLGRGGMKNPNSENVYKMEGVRMLRNRCGACVFT